MTRGFVLVYILAPDPVDRNKPQSTLYGETEPLLHREGVRALIGQALREAREQYSLTQDQIAAAVYVSPKTVSAIETGRRNLTPDLLSRLTQQLDNPWLTMEAVAEVTGGAYCTPRLDGDEVDLHRASVWAKTLEELHEAQEALTRLCLVNKPRPDDGRREAVREAMLQLLDARVAMDHMIAVACQDFGLSVCGLYAEHREKLENRGYVRRQKKSRPKAAR